MPKQIGALTLYSVDDLHDQLGLSKMTIRAYLRKGKIRGRKLGVKWYVTEEALRNYFAEPSTGNQQKPSPPKNYRYVVKGVNDLVSEQDECDTIDETIRCIENQAIISLFQVAVIDKKNDEVVELIKARDFLERHQRP
ncbi:DNA binding domain-containing protein, excisionase family [Fodinibius roseus]|uniref:DNA binding domain-containing protein, excisionase family n=1 Tax=Fodinibius roseus TaxID=1194090 RepID=A0A1M5FQ72_9BACT|nr:helix-turn-helix domain-containing protein [Fodinibius roseus]SHF93648.1 DNA binding domain-containing protein, excisionase family [Fodinibius roseus]